MNAHAQPIAPLIHIEHLTLNLPASNQVDAVIVPFSREPKKEATLRFEISADGTYVTDHKLGLIWAQAESDKSYEYAAAEVYAKDCRIGGWDDWHLPDEQELQSLRDLSRYNPCIDTNVFKSNAGWVWTRTPYAPDPTSCVFAVYFYYGYVLSHSLRNGECFVRPVRVARQ